jgi:hypothetical protein
MRYWVLLSLLLSLSVFGCEDADEGGSSALGEACTNSEDCASNLCVDTKPTDGADGPLGDTELPMADTDDTADTGLVCSQLCDVAAASCPMGYSCKVAGGASVCIPSAALGEPCTHSRDCASELCIDTGDTGLVCSQLCDEAVADLCPMGYSCTAAGYTSLCVPAI